MIQVYVIRGLIRMVRSAPEEIQQSRADFFSKELEMNKWAYVYLRAY